MTTTHSNSLASRIAGRALAGLAMLLAISPTIAAAQTGDKATVTLSDPTRPSTVSVSLLYGGITVTGYEGKELFVETRARTADLSSRNDGLKRVPIAAAGLSVTEQNNNVEVYVDSLYRPIDVTLKVPFKTSLKLSTTNEGDISVTAVEGDMDINAIGGAVTLQHVSGSAVAHAFLGTLLAVFDRVTPEKAMGFSSFRGDVDVTFPRDLRATFRISTERGEVFSDFDMVVQPSSPGDAVRTSKDAEGQTRVTAGKAVSAIVNGGGQQVQLRTYGGKIYIRRR